MELTIQDLIPAVNEYTQDINNWVSKNNLVELPEFSELHDKNIWGESYRNDQIFYETIADFKNKMFAIKSAILHLITVKYLAVSERDNKNKSEKLMTQIETEISRLDNLLHKARGRLKFYETITYVIGNVTYGAY